jgi:hypothetical protein
MTTIKGTAYYVDEHTVSHNPDGPWTIRGHAQMGPRPVMGRIELVEDAEPAMAEEGARNIETSPPERLTIYSPDDDPHDLSFAPVVEGDRPREYLRFDIHEVALRASEARVTKLDRDLYEAHAAHMRLQNAIDALGRKGGA